MGTLAGKHLILRADADSRIGTGHLMRCLALAQAWKDSGGLAALITACQDEGLLQRLTEEDFNVHILTCSYPDPGDHASTSAILSQYPESWVVLDGYHFDETYQQYMKESGHKLLMIDDMAHLNHYYADIILNQNLHVKRLHYSCEPYTRLLLGTQYVLLRREFLAWQSWKREFSEIARRVLVTLGGGDPENHTLKVVHSLNLTDRADLEATVVIGASNTHYVQLEEEIKRSHSNIRLVRDARNMPDLIAWADVAISTAGTTIWELLFLGLPILTMISADNQQLMAEQLETWGVGRNMGKSSIVSPEILAEAITSSLMDTEFRMTVRDKGPRIVDGHGTQRVIDMMRYDFKSPLKLRPAQCEDCKLLWEWSNDPQVRAASFSSDPIRWEDHVEWFKAKLNNSHWYCYIVTGELDTPIGVVRFDTHGNKADIGVSINPDFRDQGYGSKAILLASQQLFHETGVNSVSAFIKKYNTRSIRAFQNAHYKKSGIRLIKDEEALEMTLHNKDRAS